MVRIYVQEKKVMQFYFFYILRSLVYFMYDNQESDLIFWAIRLCIMWTICRSVNKYIFDGIEFNGNLFNTILLCLLYDWLRTLGPKVFGLFYV